MTDILAAIEAAIAEDERTAREATPGPWRWGHMWPPYKYGLLGAPHPVSGAPQSIVPSAVPDLLPSKYDAQHIARHDPARVLRQAEAHRRILAVHQLEDGGCESCTSEYWPCPTVRALAHAYGIEVEE